MWATLFKGAMISGSLIIAIGGQNAFLGGVDLFCV